MTNEKSRKPTNKDVARLAGVSVATVSYVINGRTDQKISEDTRKKVLHAINFLGYVPNPHATAIKTQSKSIIVRTSEKNGTLHNLEVLEIVRILTEVCKKQDCAVYFSADTAPSRVSATACVCIGMPCEEFHAVANENFIPLIALDSVVGDPVFFQITTNYARLYREAVKKVGNDFVFVTTEPNDERLKEEIASVFGNTVFGKTVFVNTPSDLKNMSGENIVLENEALSQFLSVKPALVFNEYRRKIDCLTDCINKAVSREKADDEAHYIKV